MLQAAFLSTFTSVLIFAAFDAAEAKNDVCLKRAIPMSEIAFLTAAFKARSTLKSFIAVPLGAARYRRAR
jgi:hypothetical protein